MNYFPKDKEFERFAKSEYNVSSSNLDLIQQTGFIDSLYS